jgi:hypothetical protein
MSKLYKDYQSPDKTMHCWIEDDEILGTSINEVHPNATYPLSNHVTLTPAEAKAHLLKIGYKQLTQVSARTSYGKATPLRGATN